MNRLSIAVLLALCLAPSVSTAIDIKTPRPCYMPFGPTRTDKTYYPGEKIWITFDVEGLKIDDKSGKANYETTLEFLDLKDDQKKVLYKNTEQNMVRPQLGGTRMPVQVDFQPGFKQLPGKYALRMTVQDKIAKEGKAFTYEFEVVGETFGLFGVSSPAVVSEADKASRPGFAVVHVGLDKDQKAEQIEDAVDADTR